jgi:hypothetical protein
MCYKKSSLSNILIMFPRTPEALSCEMRLCRVRRIYGSIDVDDADDESEKHQDGKRVKKSIDDASNRNGLL